MAASTSILPEDYNISSQERRRLLEDIKQSLKNEDVYPAFWACCQLADLDSLKALAEARPSIIVHANDMSTWIIRHWNQKARETVDSSESTTPRGSDNTRKRKVAADGTPWVERSSTQKELCKRRDNHCCVLTKLDLFDVAHIYPYSMLIKPSTKSRFPGAIPDFWGLLWAFWRDDQIERWQKAIFPDPEKPTRVEACFNLICLGPHVHAMWNEGLFALKPLELSPDGKELKVQFFWQPRYNHKIGDKINLLMDTLSSEGLRRVGNSFLNYLDDGETPGIVSGQVFTLKTENPDEQPLPNWDLLDMQWKLQRVVGMSGAAELSSLGFDDDDDDDDSPAPTPIFDNNSESVTSSFSSSKGVNN